MIAHFVTGTVELIAGGQRAARDIKFVATFGEVLINIAFCLTKCRFQHQVIFEIVFSTDGVQVIDLGLLIVLIEVIHFQMPRCLVLVGPHVGEAQCTVVAVVKVSPGFSTLIGTWHKAPVWC